MYQYLSKKEVTKLIKHRPYHKFLNIRVLLMELLNYIVIKTVCMIQMQQVRRLYLNLQGIRLMILKFRLEKMLLIKIR